jgi:hypothetical protein
MAHLKMIQGCTGYTTKNLQDGQAQLSREDNDQKILNLQFNNPVYPTDVVDPVYPVNCFMLIVWCYPVNCCKNRNI